MLWKRPLCFFEAIIIRFTDKINLLYGSFFDCTYYCKRTTGGFLMHHDSYLPKRNIGKDFCKCGLTGWCLECVWTGLGSLENIGKDRRLFCRTSLWMFPIYGLAAFLPAVYHFIRTKCLLFRATIYSGTIFLFEFLSGTLLRRLNACPWDYSNSKLNIKGLIRLDYAPFWAMAGLLFERLLCHNKPAKS